MSRPLAFPTVTGTGGVTLRVGPSPLGALSLFALPLASLRVAQCWTGGPFPLTPFPVSRPGVTEEGSVQGPWPVALSGSPWAALWPQMGDSTVRCLPASWEPAHSASRHGFALCLLTQRELSSQPWPVLAQQVGSSLLPAPALWCGGPEPRNVPEDSQLE